MADTAEGGRIVMEHCCSGLAFLFSPRRVGVDAWVGQGGVCGQMRVARGTREGNVSGG